MLDTRKLTTCVVRSHIQEFVDRYNAGDYMTACDFYAAEVLYYDGMSTAKKSREAILADIKSAAQELFHAQPIALEDCSIDTSIDGRSAIAHMRFIIDKGKFAVQMTVEWIDDRPQVTFDRTIAI